MDNETITCFLCGGVYVYPGQRFSNHLLHEHGVVYNHEYIISVSQYKDSCSTLPPIIPSNPKLSLDQFTQTVDSTCSKCAAQHRDVFDSLSPVKSVSPLMSSLSIPHRNYHYPSPFSTSTPKASTLLDSFPHVSAIHAVKNQEHLPPPLQQDLESVAQVKSGFIFKCALCRYSARDDTTFRSHLAKRHEMDYRIYKDRYGNSETPVGSGKFKCRICEAMMKHLPGSVLKHLRSKHKITWEQYIDIVRIPSEEPKVEIKTEGKEKISKDALVDSRSEEQKVEIKTERKEKLSENTLDDSRHSNDIEGNVVDIKRKFADTESIGCEADNVESSGRSHQTQSTECADSMSNTITTSYSNLPVEDSGENPVFEVIPPPIGTVRMEGNSARIRKDKKCRVKCIKDKNNKYCSQCDLSFISRILFLRHCQDVHKLRFKNKYGKPLLLNENSSTGVKGQNLSMPSKLKSPSDPNDPPRNSSPSRSQGPNSLPSVSSLSSNSTLSKARSVHACQFCQKVFSSLSNMWRHVKQSCTFRGDQGIVQGSGEGGGFKCRTCGKVYLRLGYLNRHYESSKCDI